MREQKLNLDGYRFPAEWEPHEATWLSWPHADGISFPGCYEEILPTYLELIQNIAASEKVYLNVRDAHEEKLVRDRFPQGLPASLRFFYIPTNEPWCRDHGPIFLTSDRDQKQLILDWGYNAWGGKYPPFDLDDDVPTRVGQALQIPSQKISMVLEGGSIDTNGAGTLLTTESCLLNPNRNPSLSKEIIEEQLRHYLGVRQILWLGNGIEGDDTDGHVDDLTRFVSHDTVVTVVEENRQDTNYEPLQENYRRLQEMKLWDGRPLKVVKLPMPAPVIQEDSRLPASYANFYITNQSVLLPVFSDRNDTIAVNTLKKVFPMRKIVPIDCRKLVWGLGTFHCLTQQMPSVT